MRLRWIVKQSLRRSASFALLSICTVVNVDMSSNTAMKRGNDVDGWIPGSERSVENSKERVNGPLKIIPVHEKEHGSIDIAVTRVLLKLRPSFRNRQVSVNEMVHALRLTGIGSERSCSQCLSGSEMLRLLTTNVEFWNRWPDAEGPLILSGPSGLAVRTGNGGTRIAHKDQMLAALAEVGAPLSLKIQHSRGRGDLNDVLEYSLEAFNLNHRELEWSAVAFALYLPPQDSWRGVRGEVVTFDDVAERLMRFPPTFGACMGQHRLYALVVLLRVDEQVRILAPDTRGSILELLSGTSGVLASTQNPKGFWQANWVEDSSATEEEVDALEGRLRVTTHVLEWWALAPARVLPEPEVVERAVKWVVSVVEDLDEAQVHEHYTTLSHAGRALKLWQGELPTSFGPS